MTFVDDFTLFIDKHDTWDASNTVDITAIRFVSPVMFNGGPFFALDVIFESGHVLIDTQTDNLDDAVPFWLLLGQHVDVVLHWFLAWWAPCSPKVKEPNLTFFVQDFGWGFLAHLHDFSDGIVGISCSDSRGKLD